MIILPLQWENHRGPDAVGSHKITFSLDESISTEFNPMKIKKGTQFIAILVEANSKEADEFRNETPEETTERFRKRMNSLINQVADVERVPSKEFRESFKEELRTSGIIKESTKELDLSGYARVIQLLLTKLPQ